MDLVVLFENELKTACRAERAKRTACFRYEIHNQLKPRFYAFMTTGNVINKNRELLIVIYPGIEHLRVNKNVR